MKQRGNAVFLVMIAIALFAMLAYSFTISDRQKGTIDKENAALAATEIISFFPGIKTAILRMLSRGILPAEINFNTTVSGENVVFAANGGNVFYRPLPPNIGNATDWGFRDLTDPTNGFYVKDVGSNTNVSGREAFGGVADISLAVCQQINKALSLPMTPAINSATTGVATIYAVGTNVLDAYPGKLSACLQSSIASGGVYLYYHVLIAQ